MRGDGYSGGCGGCITCYGAREGLFPGVHFDEFDAGEQLAHQAHPLIRYDYGTPP